MKTEKAGAYFKKLSYIILTLVITANIADSQAYKIRMATVGNSITYGALLANPATECYPAQLGNMLSEVYGDTVEIKNFSVSGRTMMRSAETPLWNEPQFLSALKYVPDICLILLGTNDSKPYRWDAWGDEFLGDYLAMIDTFRFRNPYTKFIVCSPPPIWPGHPYGDTFSTRHNDSVLVNKIIPLIDTVAVRTGSILIDFHTPLTDSIHLFPDQLHPNVQGSKVMAEIVYNKIVENDLIHQVEPGLAFVSSFEQSKSLVPAGIAVELKWTTINADSVFLDGVSVDPSGSIEVIAEVNKVYTLAAKGSKNTSDYLLYLNAYNPEKSGLIISTSSSDYSNGNPVILYVDYIDQEGLKMNENTSNITWSFIEGEGEFGDQTDTSIVFIPVATGNIIVKASEGDLSVQKTLKVNNLTSVSGTINSVDIEVLPNPVKSTLYFRLENINSKKVQIRVYNLLGVPLIDQEFRRSGQETLQFELNTSGLNQGVYVYVIYFDEKAKYGQFVKVAGN